MTCHDPKSLASDGAVESGATVFVCTTCRRPDDDPAAPRAGADLAQAVAVVAHGSGIAVTPLKCLGNCNRGLTAAMSRPDGWSYVFGNLSLENAADIIDGARLYAASGDGLMPWRGRPECLKRGLISRVPPLTYTEEDT